MTTGVFERGAGGASRFSQNKSRKWNAWHAGNIFPGTGKLLPNYVDGYISQARQSIMRAVAYGNPPDAVCNDIITNVPNRPSKPAFFCHFSWKFHDGTWKLCDGTSKVRGITSKVCGVSSKFHGISSKFRGGTSNVGHGTLKVHGVAWKLYGVTSKVADGRRRRQVVKTTRCRLAAFSPAKKKFCRHLCQSQPLAGSKNAAKSQ